MHVQVLACACSSTHVCMFEYSHVYVQALACASVSTWVCFQLQRTCEQGYTSQSINYAE